MTTTTAQRDAQGGPPASLPLFYQRPVPLQAGLHAHHGLRRDTDFSLAAAATAIPANIGEFLPALRSYPIVFSNTEAPTPLLVLGLKEGQNLFVDATGAWRPHTYVPAYLRRHPFILIETSDRQTRMLGFDEAAPRITAGDDEASDRFFDDAGQPAAVAQSALAFCQAFHEDHLRTTEFMAAVAAARILVPNKAEIQFPDHSRYTLDGFRVIDETALRNLPTETVAEWHRKGWLALAHLHLASQQNWGLLLDAHKNKDPSQ